MSAVTISDEVMEKVNIKCRQSNKTPFEVINEVLSLKCKNATTSASCGWIALLGVLSFLINFIVFYFILRFFEAILCHEFFIQYTFLLLDY